MKKILLVVIGVVVLCVVILFLLHIVNSQQTKTPATQTTSNQVNTAPSKPIASNATTTEMKLDPVLYPLYPGASWHGAPDAVIDGAPAAEVQSVQFTNITDLASKFQPFISYYENILTKNGWVVDVSREAGGPGSESTMYRKGNDFVIISYQSIFHVQSDNAPEQCPCDLQFTLESGTKNN